MTLRRPYAAAARRPRFLAGVPDVPAALPVRFLGPDQPEVLASSGGDDAAGRSRSAAAAAGAAPAPDPAALAAEARREALANVAGAVAALRDEARRLGEAASADALEVGFQVARRILETEVRQDPDAVLALVRSAMRRAGDSRRVAVRVAPEDAELLHGDGGRTALRGVTAARVEIVADPSLQRGDCVVEADFGQVDGRLATRVAELRRAVDTGLEGAA